MKDLPKTPDLLLPMRPKVYRVFFGASAMISPMPLEKHGFEKLVSKIPHRKSHEGNQAVKNANMLSDVGGNQVLVRGGLPDRMQMQMQMRQMQLQMLSTQGQGVDPDFVRAENHIPRLTINRAASSGRPPSSGRGHRPRLRNVFEIPFFLPR